MKILSALEPEEVEALKKFKTVYFDADTDYHYLEEHIEKVIFPIIDHILQPNTKGKLKEIQNGD